MPLLQKGAAAIANRMPKVISPKAHAIADYITIGTWGLLAYLFWERNRPAALAAMSCGIAELTTTLLTDFPGGVTDLIDFPTHGRIDMGLAATSTALPNLAGFDEEPEAKWFRILGLNITAVTGMTQFHELGRERRRKAA